MRTSALIEGSRDGVFVCDESGLFTEASTTGCSMLGYSREELLGRSITEILPSTEAARQAHLLSHVRAGVTEVSEWNLRRKDGTYIPAEIGLTALPEGHVVAFVRDITDRRKAEDRLKLSEAMFTGIVSSSPDAIITIDADYRINMVNQGAVDMFGHSKEEMLGLPFDTLIPERLRPVHQQHVQGFAAGPAAARRMGARSTNIVALRKNGEEFPVDAAISRFEVGDKKLYTVTVHDISDQKRIEREERFLAEVGHALVTAVSDSELLITEIAGLVVRQFADWFTVTFVDGNGLRRMRLVHADPNKAGVCEALERLPLQHTQRSPVTQVLGAQQPMLVAEVTSGFLESMADSPEHLRLLSEFGMTSFVMVPLTARGQPLGTLAFGFATGSRRCTAHEVTVAQRLASRVALAVDNVRLHDALERSVRARDEVLAVVAHDLRNPLNTIVMSGETLRRPGGEHERRNQKPAQRIQRAAERMHRLIQDLLDVARLEAGQHLSISLNDLHTSIVLAEGIDQQRAAIAGSKRTLTVDVADKLPCMRADRERFLQVLENLLGNALKFSRTCITVGATPKDGEVLFWVGDDGHGISPNHLAHLFDRFWQATKSDTRGAGLGLSIAKEIVDAHGGRLWAESEVGVGTTFYFTFPAV